MLFKESGYDEFLADKVKQGREDIAQGRVYTREQLQEIVEATLAKKALELDEMKRENLTYA